LTKALSDDLTPTYMILQKYYYGIRYDGRLNTDGNFSIKKTIGISGIISMSLKTQLNL